jgi:hypothetical protein
MLNMESPFPGYGDATCIYSIGGSLLLPSKTRDAAPGQTLLPAVSTPK